MIVTYVEKKRRVRVNLVELTAEKTDSVDIDGPVWKKCRPTKKLLSLALRHIMERYLAQEARYNGKPDKRFKRSKEIQKTT